MIFLHLLLHLLASAETANAWTEIEFRGTIFCYRSEFEYKLSLLEVDMISDDTLYEDPDFIVVRNGSQDYRAFGGCENDGREDNWFEIAIHIEHTCNPKREVELIELDYDEVAIKNSKVYFRRDYHLHEGDRDIEKKTFMTTVDKDTNSCTCQMV